ncbi:MAG: TfoX/Sxy family protein [Flavobacteriaceae bacterium]|nr:TfoX/Sxy family protein [Flavobacteriaceae bacterium]
MAYNEALAENIREHLVNYGDHIIEKKMFGGICFLYKGKMSIGIVKNELAVRVVSHKMEGELEKHNVRPMDFTKKPMKEFIYVELENERNLPYWIELGIEHAKSKLK